MKNTILSGLVLLFFGCALTAIGGIKTSEINIQNIQDEAHGTSDTGIITSLFELIASMFVYLIGIIGMTSGLYLLTFDD